MPFNNGGRVRLAVFACLLVVSSYANAGTVFSYASAPGDYIGAGQSGVYTPKNAVFSIRGTGDSVTVYVDAKDGARWSIDLAAPNGTRLSPGGLYKVERAAFRSGRSGGLDVSGNSRGCNQVWGEVGVRQVAYDADGQVASLEANFTQRCENDDAPELSGVVRYEMPQLSLRLDSDPGDYIGQEIEKSYYNDTSVFALVGTRNGLQYAASGQRDDWLALIAPPTGRTLRAGNYRTARFADATHAGFDFFGNGRGCNQTTGTLRIYAITSDSDGRIKTLAADFEQHCEGGTAALRGSIRYGF